METSANLLVQQTNIQRDTYYVTEDKRLIYVIDVTSNKNCVLAEICLDNSNEWLPINDLLGARKVKAK